MPDRNLPMRHRNIAMPDRNLAMRHPKLAMPDRNLPMADRNVAMRDRKLPIAHRNIAMRDRNIAMRDPNIAMDDPTAEANDPDVGTRGLDFDIRDPAIDTNGGKKPSAGVGGRLPLGSPIRRAGGRMTPDLKASARARCTHQPAQQRTRKDELFCSGGHILIEVLQQMQACHRADSTRLSKALQLPRFRRNPAASSKRSHHLGMFLSSRCGSAVRCQGKHDST